MTPRVVAQAPLSMEFSRQEYWSGLPFPSAGDLPDPAIEPGSPALQVDPLLSEPPEGLQGSMKLFKKNSSSTWPSTSFISVSPLVLYMIKRKIIYFQTFVFCLSCEFFSVLFSTICLCGKFFF